MRGVTERRELSSIAYGFMASKALFAALGVDLFTHLAIGARTTAELSDDTGIAAHRLRTLLHALSAVGLIVAEGQYYTNATACQRYLVRGAPGEFGEYFRLQVAQQIYPALVHLDAGLAGRERGSTRSPTCCRGPTTPACSPPPSTPGRRPPPASSPKGRHWAAPAECWTSGAAAGHFPSPCAPGTHACVRRSWTSRPWSTSPGPTATSPVSARAFRSDGVSFSAAALSGRLRDHGFVPAPSEVLIPETAKTILSRKAST